MLLQAGRALDAREHFEIIVRARPTYLDAAAMLGLACYLAGDGLGAKQVWEACRDRRPEDPRVEAYLAIDRKSTRLNSSHGYISYAVFCLKKKKKNKKSRHKMLITT